MLLIMVPLKYSGCMLRLSTLERFETELSMFSGEARGFKVGGLRGRVREGGAPPPGGGSGLCPRKNFQITDARRRVLAHFSDKINTSTPVFMPVGFGKVPNPFDFQRLSTEDATKNRHEAPQKLQNSSLSVVLVDDLLLASFALVRLSRFQVV
jgi:hypothetical protein